MTETVTRRRLLGCVAGLLGAGFGGGAVLSTASEPAVALEGAPSGFEAADTPPVEHNDGRVDAVLIAPEIDIDWRNFGSGVESVTLEIAVAGSAGIDELSTETLTYEDLDSSGDSDDEPADGLADIAGFEVHADGDEDSSFDAVDGTLSVSFERIDLTARGDAVDSDALSDESLASGEHSVTTLELIWNATLSGREGESVSVLESTTFDVTVANPEGAATGGGEANTDAR